MTFLRAEAIASSLSRKISRRVYKTLLPPIRSHHTHHRHLCGTPEWSQSNMLAVQEGTTTGWRRDFSIMLSYAASDAAESAHAARRALEARRLPRFFGRYIPSPENCGDNGASY
jgi:hypothetical protein